MLVTGASRGIGRAIAVGMARAGADVLALARSESDLGSVADEVAAIGSDAHAIVCDVADVAAIHDAVLQAWEWKSGVDVLVNAAGMIIRSEPPSVSAAEWDRVHAVNARAPFFFCQWIGERMLKGRGGSIVNVTSLAGEVATGAAVTYQSSKAALIQLTRALASRWGPDIRVNCVGPGYIKTALNEDWLAQPGHTEYVIERTALQRVGTPADVVGASVFLASPAAAYITGQHIRVDGGWGR